MELFSEIERSLSMRRVSARRQEVAATGVESGVQIAVIGANATKFQHRERETFRAQRRSANWLVFFFCCFSSPRINQGASPPPAYHGSLRHPPNRSIHPPSGCSPMNHRDSSRPTTLTASLRRQGGRGLLSWPATRRSPD